MPTVNDFQCWVDVGGTAMQEYSIENTDDVAKGQQTTCWVASEAGKKFIVHWLDKSAYGVRTTATYVYLDGEAMGGKFLKPNSIGKTSLSGKALDAHTERPFMFAMMETTDDDNYLAHSISQSTGEIRVEIWGAIELGYVAPASQAAATQDAYGKVHERSKKAINHRIELGAPTAGAVKQTFISVTKRGTAPLATFTFKYRDMPTLQANGIAPPPVRAPTPVQAPAPVRAPTPVDVKPKKRPAPVVDDDDEIEILDGDVFKKEGETKPRIFKNRTSSAGSSKRVKTEASKQTMDPEIIDLT